MMRLPNRCNLWIKAVLVLLLVWCCIGLASIQVRGRLVSEALAASALDGVIEGAKKEGKVVIYESQSLAAWSKIMGAFQKRYPFVKEWNQEQLTAADVPTRIVNESRAGAPTADLFGNSPPTSIPLIQRGLVVEVAWKTLGVLEKTIYDRYTVLGNMFAYVIGYNTQMISSRDVPKTWEGLLDPKWKGKGGWWRAASPWNALAAEWGISKTEEYLKKFLANDFRPSRTQADVATWVAAGEVPLA
ncbi:MAG: extracellular solute-binding protein, partial [Deltaproteobacteria bacterium]|nr:extracellular solute-binding protein [Deltaproteobacteria bacterium]